MVWQVVPQNPGELVYSQACTAPTITNNVSTPRTPYGSTRTSRVDPAGGKKNRRSQFTMRIIVSPSPVQGEFRLRLRLLLSADGTDLPDLSVQSVKSGDNRQHQSTRKPL